MVGLVFGPVGVFHDPFVEGLPNLAKVRKVYLGPLCAGRPDGTDERQCFRLHRFKL